MNVSDFDYELPEELIAQQPPAVRGTSRMLVLDRQSGDYEAQSFADFPSYLRPGDCLVINDTKVIPARIFGTRAGTGGKVEALLLEEVGEGEWDALLRPGRRLKPGAKVLLEDSAVHFEVVSRDEEVFRIRFDTKEVLDVLRQIGSMPLPPYIQRPADSEDAKRYQTVFADDPGAVAAPTAGLHFTDGMLQEIAASGVAIVRLTLHVGLGTFQPVSAETVEEHVMHEERYVLPEDAATAINAARAGGGRVVAVGTTSVRTLETCAREDGTVQAGAGRTDIFLYPPYEPKAVDCLLTNFHLPRSTLLMLVSCFVDREEMLAAYAYAVKEQFRFYSYGDCMFLRR